MKTCNIKNSTGTPAGGKKKKKPKKSKSKRNIGADAAKPGGVDDPSK